MKQIERVRQLLPWYITGKLSSTEVTLVKEAIASCPSLYKEYKVQWKLSQLIKEDPKVVNMSVMSTQEERLDVLMQRICIHSDQQQTVMTENNSPSFFMKILVSSQQVLMNVMRLLTNNKWTFTAVVMVVAIQVALFGFLLTNHKPQAGGAENSYISASVDTAIVSSGERIIIQFDVTATQDDINRFLQTIDAKTIEHPDGSYSYQLALNKDMSVKQIEILLVKIRENKLIRFADKGF